MPQSPSPGSPPDSQHIAFNSNRSRDGLREIFQANRDGSGIVEIAAYAPSGAYAPAYAPAGDKIAFTSNINGNVHILTESLTTRRTTIETALVGNAEFLSWQPTVGTAVTATPNPVARGGQLQVAASGLGAGESVSVTLADAGAVTTTLGTLTADPTGHAAGAVSVPGTVAPGTATLTVTGTVTRRRAHTSLTVS